MAGEFIRTNVTHDFQYMYMCTDGYFLINAHYTIILSYLSILVLFSFLLCIHTYMVHADMGFDAALILGFTGFCADFNATHDQLTMWCLLESMGVLLRVYLEDLSLMLMVT